MQEEVQEEPFKIHPAVKRPRHRRHFRTGRFRPYGYPVYQPMYQPMYQPVYTKPTEEYNYCVQTSGRCQDAFENEHGKPFNPELCGQLSVQNFAKSLRDDCHPHTKENYSCRNNLSRNGNWSAGVL